MLGWAIDMHKYFCKLHYSFQSAEEKKSPLALLTCLVMSR